MSRTTDAIRAFAARARVRKGAPSTRRRASVVATSILAAAVSLSLSSAGGTTALWTGSASVTAPSIRSGSITSFISGFTGLSTTFTSSSLSKTSYVVVGNTGATTATIAVRFGLEAGSSAALAGTTTLTIWQERYISNCTETAPPVNASTFPWNGVPLLTGTVPAGMGALFCLRSRTAAANLTSQATIYPKVSVDLTLAGTGWTSTGSASATESAAPDAAVIGSDYTDAVRADGATRYWRLGEASGSILYDLIGNDDAYAATGLTRGIAGALGGDANAATTFSGDSTGTAGTRTLITAPDTFALEAWFKTTSTTGGKIVGFGSNSTGLSSSYDRHIYLDASGHVTFGVWPGSASTITTAGSFNDGAWHHVVGNLSTAGQQLYVDGNLIGTATTTTGWPYTGYWRIGGDSSWAGDAWFDGTIDEVAVYGAPLSARAVSNHWNLAGKGIYPAGVGDPYGTTVYADSPTLFWRLGETSGTAAADSGPNAHPGIYAGNVTQGAGGAVAGTRNTAASFNGTSGLVTSSQSFANPQDYSLELWFNTTSTSGGKLIGFGDAQTGTSSSYDRHVYLQNDGKVVFGSYPGNVQVITSAAAYNNGQWHHVVATQSSTTGMTLYVDGQLLGTNPATTPVSYTGYWRVGGDNLASWSNVPSSQYVTSRIDEVAVYGGVLTPAQVKRHYSVATGAPSAAFTATISGLDASVNGSASSDYDGSIAAYSWNWGDGSAAGTGVTATHSYASPGAYTVTLTVTDNSGRTDTATNVITATDVVPPTTPANLVITGNTGNTATLTWTGSTDNVAVSGYDVYRNGTFVATAAGTSYTDGNLALNTAYTYTVKARDASGNTSADSNAAAVTTYPLDTVSWYQLKASGGQCVATAALDATPLTLGTCAASPLQNFRFVGTTGAYLKGTLRALPTSVWDVSAASTAAGAAIITFAAHGGANQDWVPTAVSAGVYTFTSRVSGLCLTAPGPWAAPGTALTQEVCNPTSATQQFTLVVAP